MVGPGVCFFVCVCVCFCFFVHCTLELSLRESFDLCCETSRSRKGPADGKALCCLFTPNLFVCLPVLRFLHERSPLSSPRLIISCRWKCNLHRISALAGKKKCHWGMRFFFFLSYQSPREMTALFLFLPGDGGLALNLDSVPAARC